MTTQLQGDDGLTIKLVALGLGKLGASGLVDVAKAQGATRGLRYDPDMGPGGALVETARELAVLSSASTLFRHKLPTGP